jgi:hypothetical protein
MRLASREITLATALLIVIVLFSTIAISQMSTAVADNMASPPLLDNAQIAPAAIIVSGNNAPNQLSWTAGDPYPLVNGKVTPPPQAVKPEPNSTGGPPVTIGGHYYSGGVYHGTAHTASWIIAQVAVPSSDKPDSSEFYYVLLSAWDNAGSYDQIGFSGDYGVWGLTYSYTTGPCTSPTYHYSANALALTSGQAYLFAMTTVSGPGVWLEAYSIHISSGVGVRTLIYAQHYLTGATNPGLTVQDFYCGSYDYTVYQETYGTTTYNYPNPYGMPLEIFFIFGTNEWGTGTSGPPWTWTTWSQWWTSNAPPLNNARAIGNNIYIYD